jgi:hypothetical protein
MTTLGKKGALIGTTHHQGEDALEFTSMLL